MKQFICPHCKAINPDIYAKGAIRWDYRWREDDGTYDYFADTTEKLHIGDAFCNDCDKNLGLNPHDVKPTPPDWDKLIERTQPQTTKTDRLNSMISLLMEEETKNEISKYHESWDCLMPVVKAALEYCHFAMLNEWEDCFADAFMKADIKSMYNLVCEFIEWHDGYTKKINFNKENNHDRQRNDSRIHGSATYIHRVG